MEISISWLIITASICLAISIIEGWFLVLSRFLDIKIFPGYGYLVKSHIDYIMMSGLLFAIYLILNSLNLTLSNSTIVALTIGALYNPFGFLLQAIKPNIADTDSKIIKAGLLIGFLPAIYGFLGVAYTVILKFI